MGILKSREELLPVTCAILKEADRIAFFSKIKKSRGGKPEELARLLRVPPATVSDWMNGKGNIPYHTLQRIAHEFDEPVPPITELRRESLPTSMIAAPPSPSAMSHRAPPESKPKRDQTASRRPEKHAERPARGSRGRRAERKPHSAPTEQKHVRHRAAGTPSGKSGLLSAASAYWIGATLAGAKLREGMIVFSADRQIGQNFAAIWARRTKDVLGAAPQLSIQDKGRVQEAALPAAGLEDLIEKLGFAEASPDSEPGGLPRWIWSNPEWKAACLKGMADAAGRFQRTPSLVLSLSDPLARAALKIFAAMGFRAHPASEGVVTLSGKEQIEKYFSTVGANNFKLRDQIQSYLHPRARGRRPAEVEENSAPTEEPSSTATQPPSSSESATDSPSTPPSVPSAEQSSRSKPRRAHSKRMVFRGRPKT